MIEEIEKEANALHFEKAWQLTLQEKEPSEKLLIAKSRILRGLGLFNEALVQAEKTTTPQGKLELAKCLFAKGKIKEAKAVMEQIEPPFAASILGNASLEAESGQVKMALKQLEKVDEHKLSRLSYMDYLILLADLYSFDENEEKSFFYYGKALEQTAFCIPSNWQNLRKMLIYHNMADTCEQLEKMEEAIYYYTIGEEELKKQLMNDSSITDLSSYLIEFYLSVANCYGNADDFDKAEIYLKKAENTYKQQAPIQKEYFKARIHYIKGLIYMNDNLEEKAIEQFEKALKLQKELVKKGLDKEEHLARTAYYLGFLLPDNEISRKEDLFALATPIFKRVKEKEPSFYLSSLANMENELGRLNKDPEAYKESIAIYERLLKERPDDLLALESLAVSEINLFNLSGVLDEDRIKKELQQLKKMESMNLDLLVGNLLHFLKPSAFKDWLEDFASKINTPWNA